MRRKLCHQQIVSNTRPRYGTLTMELIFILPILMVMLLGMSEFALLFYARGQVVDAAQAGARLATLHGVDEYAVVREVKQKLPSHYGSTTQVASQLGRHAGDEVVVTVKLPSRVASPDLLWPIGYSLIGREIVAQSRMRKE